MNLSKTVVGVDTAKRVFQLHWIEQETGEIVSVQLKREKFLEHFANRAPCLIGMEACGGSQHWARKLAAMGHQIKLMPAKAVRPFVGATRMMLVPSGPLYSSQMSRRCPSRPKNSKRSWRCTACASSW